jgi:hypothetical protein
MDHIQHFGEGNLSSLPISEDALNLFDTLYRSNYITNGGKAGPAADLAYKQFFSVYQPTNFGGVPRWTMGAPEFNPELKDVIAATGSLEAAENQIIATAQAQMMNIFRDVRNLDNVLPELRSLDDLPQYMDDWANLLAATNMDDPNAALAGKSISGAALELGIRSLGSILDSGGDPTAGLAGMFHKWFDPDGPKVMLRTTPELLHYKPDPINRREWEVIGYHVEIQQQDGSFAPLFNLPGGGDQYKIFYFDKSTMPEMVAYQDAEKTNLAKSIFRHEVRMGSNETAIKEELAKAGITDPILTTGFSSSDVSDYYLSAGQTRPGLAGRGGFGAMRHVDRPDFDRERFVSENPP